MTTESGPMLCTRRCAPDAPDPMCPIHSIEVRQRIAQAWDEGFAAGAAAEWTVDDSEVAPNPYRPTSPDTQEQ